jgi:diguanylate cyclase (GGDEF)-like protein
MSDKNSTFRIIVIDDNPSIHNDFMQILTMESTDEIDTLSQELFGQNNNRRNIQLPRFEIDGASQGQEGVRRIEEAFQQGRPYALAFVDIRMPPGWDGIETIKHIWKIDKDIQIVICTAYSDYSWEETIAHLGKSDNLLILKKPFDNISVRQLACALTTKWELAEESHKHTALLQQQVTDRTLSLQKSLSLIKSTFESSSDGIIVFDNNGNVMDYNNNLINMFEIPQYIIDTKKEEIFLEYMLSKIIDGQKFLSKMKELRKKLDKVSIDVINLENGKIFECYSQPHKLEQNIIGYILDFRDITKRAKLEKELHYQATHDPLTGLFNRVMLLEQLKLALKHAAKTNSCLAVLFIDFDRFKLVNDSLSHMVGDELLISAAKRLQSVMEPEDILARLGGDEFIIVLTNVNKQSKLIERLHNLLQVLQEPFDIANNEVQRQVIITMSIGVSIYPKDGTTVDNLLRNADAAMYTAKAMKGNTFQFYTPEMSSHNLAIFDQELELRQAINNEEFFLCYQPQIDLENENMIAVEALLRWNHPTKGILLPMDFISVAEETGLIVPIGEWVMKTACMQNKAWQDAGLPPVRIAINVTSQQFKQQDLVEKVKEILQITNLEPKYFEIELTENVILSNCEVIKLVTKLRELGIVISVDDFGSGYSSLSYLHRIPLDRLKIDSSFIQHIQNKGDDEVIIRAVIAMAQNLKLEVLAEGIETKAQLNFLKKNKCTEGQGFYFSKPLTSPEFEAYLKKSAQAKKEKSDTD